MQLFDYLANYLQITWLIDLQLMNKHGRRSTPVTTVFCWRQTNLFDLSDHSQETSSHATSRYRPGSKNLLVHEQKSPPSQTLEIFIRHTSQLLFLISSITKMLVFWDVKKKTSWSHTTASYRHSEFRGNQIVFFSTALNIQRKFFMGHLTQNCSLVF